MTIHSNVAPAGSAQHFAAALPLLRYFQEHHDSLWHAARLIGGYEQTRLVEKLAARLQQERRLSPQVRIMTEQLLALLALEPDVVNFGFFVPIDPADPAVAEICVLTDDLRDALDEAKRRRVPVSGTRPGPPSMEAVMTAHFSGLRARRAAHAETRIARVRAYLGANRTELARVMRVASGEHDAAQTAILAGLVGRPRPQIAPIFALLEEMRDALVSAETEAGDGVQAARPDLDAAVRWHGARLDEPLAAG